MLFHDLLCTGGKYLPRLHVVPVYPVTQSQVYPNPSMLQVPAFRQGLGSQGLDEEVARITQKVAIHVQLWYGNGNNYTYMVGVFMF